MILYALYDMVLKSDPECLLHFWGGGGGLDNFLYILYILLINLLTIWDMRREEV